MRKAIAALAAAFVLALGGGLLSACMGGPADPTHEHTVESWTVVTEPTCTKEGKREGTCTVCNEKVEETLPMREHEGKTIALTKSATCTEPGVRRVLCNSCGNEVDVAIPALGHDWDRDTMETIREANCTETGLVHRTCKRKSCGFSEDATIPALGHDWEMEYTVDAKASFDAAGSRSRHCTRCAEKTDVTEIPQLKEGVATGYEFRLVRSNGDLVTVANIGYTVKDAAGETVAEGKFRSGKFLGNLAPQTYTLTLNDLPEGYSALSSPFTFEPTEFSKDGNVLCEATVKGSVITDPATDDTKYVVGSVMHDFEYTDVMTNKAIKLSALLTEKKLVLINFWYVDCQYCRLEFPELQTLYRQYGDEIAIVAVNASHYLYDEGMMGAPDPKQSIINFVKGAGYTFNFVEDLSGGPKLSYRLPLAGTPCTYMVDREGVVCAVVDGYVEGANEARLRTVIEQYVGEPAAAPASAAPVAMLPARKEN